MQAALLCPYACIVIQRISQLALANATQIAHQTAKSSALISRNQEGEKVQHKTCWRVHTERREQAIGNHKIQQRNKKRGAKESERRGESCSVPKQLSEPRLEMWHLITGNLRHGP